MSISKIRSYGCGLAYNPKEPMKSVILDVPKWRKFINRLAIAQRSADAV